MDYDMGGEGNSVLLEPGWHNVVVINVSFETSKSGNEMWVITTEEPKTGSVDKVYAITTKGKRWLLKSFFDACGFAKDDQGTYKNVTQDAALGMTVAVKNQPEQNSFVTRSGEQINEMRNKFVLFKKADAKATL